MSYVKCNGCGDRGDAAHVNACMQARRESAFYDGAMWMMLLVELQLHRRGRVDFDALLSARPHKERRRSR